MTWGYHHFRKPPYQPVCRIFSIGFVSPWVFTSRIWHPWRSFWTKKPGWMRFLKMRCPALRWDHEIWSTTSAYILYGTGTVYIGGNQYGKMMAKWCQFDSEARSEKVQRVRTDLQKAAFTEYQGKEKALRDPIGCTDGGKVKHDVSNYDGLCKMSTKRCTKVSLAGFGRSTRCLQKTALRGVVLQPCLDCFDCTWKERNNN